MYKAKYDWETEEITFHLELIIFLIQKQNEVQKLDAKTWSKNISQRWKKYASQKDC